MRLKPIRSEIDYDTALKAIERYFSKPPKKGTAEADRFDVLATLIEAYERERWPIAEADPVDVIRYRMEITAIRRLISPACSGPARAPPKSCGVSGHSLCP